MFQGHKRRMWLQTSSNIISHLIKNGEICYHCKLEKDELTKYKLLLWVISQ